MKQARFDITWRRLRELEGPQECKGLDPRTLAARLRRAIANSGPVVVEKLEAVPAEEPLSRAESAIERVIELEHSFNLRWKADMRAIKMWHAAGGDELTWPDHADLVVWLLERLKEVHDLAARELAEEPDGPYLVMLEKGVYLTGGEGDPPRTLDRKNAVWFQTEGDASDALTRAREHRPFANAQLIRLGTEALVKIATMTEGAGERA